MNMRTKISKIMKSRAGVLVLAALVLAAGAYLYAPAAMAACESWDNRYKYDCWGRWISSAPARYVEGQNGSPFSITGGHDKWAFAVEGTKTPSSSMPTEGEATYNGKVFGRAAGASRDTSSAMLFPVTGNVRANVDFDGSSSELDLRFSELQIHRITTGENPIDLRDINISDMDINGNGFEGVGNNGDFDDGSEGKPDRPWAPEWYNSRLRYISRSAGVKGNFYGAQGEGLAGILYYAVAQYKGRPGTGKRLLWANPNGFRGSNGCGQAQDSCAPVYWRVRAAFGALD